MLQTFFKWLRLDAQNYIPAVWYAVAVIWLALVVMSIFSVRSQTITAQSKTIWTSLIILLPMGGLFAYCLYCLTRIDYHMVDFLFRKKPSRS